MVSSVYVRSSWTCNPVSVDVDPARQVAVMHMACAVEAAVEGGEAGEAAAKAAAAGTEEVTFLYRLTPGGAGVGIRAEGSG